LFVDAFDAERRTRPVPAAITELGGVNEMAKTRRRSASQGSCGALGVIARQLSPEEALVFFAGFASGTKVEQLAYHLAAARKARELLNGGSHLEASRIFLDLGMKKLARGAILRGIEAHRDDPDKTILNRLHELQEELKYLPGPG
jgi:hypothetical protein